MRTAPNCGRTLHQKSSATRGYAQSRDTKQDLSAVGALVHELRHPWKAEATTTPGPICTRCCFAGLPLVKGFNAPAIQLRPPRRMNATTERLVLQNPARGSGRRQSARRRRARSAKSACDTNCRFGYSLPQNLFRRRLSLESSTSDSAIPAHDSGPCARPARGRHVPFLFRHVLARLNQPVRNPCRHMVSCQSVRVCG